MLGFVTFDFFCAYDEVPRAPALWREGALSEDGRLGARRRGTFLEARVDLPTYPHYGNTLDRARSIAIGRDERGTRPRLVLHIQWRGTKGGRRG